MGGTNPSPSTSIAMASSEKARSKAPRFKKDGNQPQQPKKDKEPERRHSSAPEKPQEDEENRPVERFDLNNSIRPVENSIWDWETPAESVGEYSSSYYYEPQGELLREQYQRQGRTPEVSLPATTASDGDFRGFVAPRQISRGGRTTSGVKRKCSLGALYERSASRRMSESGELSRSPSRLETPLNSAHPEMAGIEVADDEQQYREINSEPLRPPPPPIAGPSSEPKAEPPNRSMSMALPARKVFPIQIGDKLFRLSGASISSDAPSYFSQFFEEQLRQVEGAENVRTLYVDRDPATFEDIALHLQGYHIQPRDGSHFVKLFADAQYFSLPRLTAQLYSSTIYIRIGNEEFQIPRELFSNPGDSPNYFSLGLSVFFTTPTDVFPGLSQRTLLRPPSILPPSVPNKSAKTFADLLHILKGYPVEIRNPEHRQELLRDARYFHLKGLEQRLVPHQISFNLARNTTEIVIRLEDIRQSGVSFVRNSTPSSRAAEPAPSSSATSNASSEPGWVYYQRPYVDREARCLIVELGGDEHTLITLGEGSPQHSRYSRVGRATFFKQTLARITSLFSVIANKIKLPVTLPLGQLMLERGAGLGSLPPSPRNTGLSEEKVKIRIGPDADVKVNGKPWTIRTDDSDDEDEEDGEDDDENEDESAMEVESQSSRPKGATRRRQKRRRLARNEGGEEWIVRKAQWRLRVQPVSYGDGGGGSGMELILGAVKIDAYSNERARNVVRGFLPV